MTQNLEYNIFARVEQTRHEHESCSCHVEAVFRVVFLKYPLLFVSRWTADQLCGVTVYRHEGS